MATPDFTQTNPIEQNDLPARLTTLRAELNRLHRARKASPRNRKHYDNQIAQIKLQMAAVYAEMFSQDEPLTFAGAVVDRLAGAVGGEQ